MTVPRSVSLRRQEGFTMALVMGFLLMATTLGLAAFAAARGDIHVSGDSKNRKEAFAAAEAGINWYQSRLAADNAYWAKCDSVPAVAAGVPAPVNQVSTATSALKWRGLPGSTARYTLELLPAPGQSACSTSAPDTSMVDPASGTFRIRSTGEYNGQRRSIVTRFRRARFLDFLWFTKYETTDPLAYPDLALDHRYFTDKPDPYTYRDYANDYCADRYRTDRDSTRYAACREITFVAGDSLNGPVHSNDSMLICGSATFGSNANDRVESSQSEPTSSTQTSPGWRPSCSNTTPNFVAPFRTGQPTLDLPATNATLTANATAAYTFTGTTTMVLNADGTMTVTNAAKGYTNKVIAWPANGFVYVNSGSCGSTQAPVDQTYTEPAGCANVYVKGTYAKDLTIASAKDIVVYGDVQRSGDVLLGLIADQFVRVYHPTDSNCANSSTPTWGNYLSTVTIEAAVMSLQHSFTADNQDCGSALGNLVVKGAIAQKYRGAVGSTDGNGQHGFIKNYNYDTRMRYRNPPFFIDPVNAAWRVQRSNEQVPAAR